MGTMISRRGFFGAAAGAAVWAQDKRNIIVRSSRPEDLEMELSGFRNYITPVEDFFVRTHVYAPKVDLRDWRLTVEGDVAAPLTLTMDDLRKLPPVELVSVLECAGNGRAFFDPPVAGMQWSNGAVGNGRWRGVKLADVLKRAGIKPSAVEVLFDGADVPIQKMPDFQRSIPVKKALDPNTLLAFEMNGAPLPEKHGFPLRAVVPGWAGDSWTKWLTAIRVLDREFDGFWMKSAYRFPARAIEPGKQVPPEATRPVQSLRVKSVIAAPATTSFGSVGTPITIRGAAWGGEQGGPVASVNVSTDGGRSWKPARLSGEAAPFGWRLWEFTWTPEREGAHTILAQARDRSGDAQPYDQDWNPSGYLWNVVPRLRLNVFQGFTGGASVSIPAQPEPQQPRGFRDACLGCHSTEPIRQQRLTREQWNREIDKMAGWGAAVKPEDREGLLSFLSTNYGVR